MPALLTFFGRLHPLLVHLPIGILLIALLLQLLSRGPSRAAWKPAADLTLGLGVAAAVFSCCTGYLLYLSGDYDPATAIVHLWLAVSLTIVAGWLYIRIRGGGDRRGAGDQRGGGQQDGGRQSGGADTFSRVLACLAVVLLFLTGHWGGTLTHGPGYLTAGLEGEPVEPLLRPVVNVQSAVVYDSLVRPVLHDNCYGCHRAGRIKGGLRLDAPEWIRKGGKDGPVIVPGNETASLLIKRILLPLDDEHHMAPREKSQLTAAEIRLLQWWVRTGASFDKPVSGLPQDETARVLLQAFHAGTAGPVGGVAEGPSTIADSDLPVTPVAPADAGAVRRLEAAGALVLPVAQGSNYLAVSFPADSMGKDALPALPQIKDQLVELKCSNTRAGDELVAAIGGCTHLVRLWLDHTAVSGANFDRLQALSRLRYLNLTGTAVTGAEILKLNALQGLRSIYLYQTRVDKAGWDAVRKAFPHALLDTGGYRMPFLTTDTAQVRPQVGHAQ